MILVYIAVGGALGAAARYGLTGWVHGWSGFGFPWGTLVVNVLGSFLVGFALRYLEALRFAPEMRALVVIGLLGAFTTFSTFSYETVGLLEEGEWARAGLYAAGSLAFGIAAVYAGLMAAAYVLHVRG